MRRRADGGYTYIVVLVLLAVISAAAALTLESADTAARRAAEAELIGLGRELERAFASYYRQSPPGTRRYPERLEDLVRDPRVPGLRRHLRKVYVDPLTGGEWGTVPAPGGGIMAVYSPSKAEPFRLPPAALAMGLPASAAAPDAPRSYGDWRFGYDPRNDRRNPQAVIRPSLPASAPFVRDRLVNSDGPDSRGGSPGQR